MKTSIKAVRDEIAGGWTDPGEHSHVSHLTLLFIFIPIQPSRDVFMPGVCREGAFDSLRDVRVHLAHQHCVETHLHCTLLTALREITRRKSTRNEQPKNHWKSELTIAPGSKWNSSHACSQEIQR